VLIWRKGARSSKISALLEVLREDAADLAPPKRRKPKS